MISPQDIRSTVVVGAGTMGHGIAQVFAQHGLEVALVDTDEIILSQAMEHIQENLKLLVEYEIISPEGGSTKIAETSP